MGTTTSTAPTAPHRCKLVRRYLAGNVRARWRARSSVTRWRKRVFPREADR